MVKIKNINLEAVSRVLVTTQEQKLVNKVGFFILQANAVITRELQPYLEMRKTVHTHKSIEKFSEEKQELLIKHSDKDANGKPIIIKGEKFSEYQIGDQLTFSKHLKTLTKKHEKALTEYNDIQLRFSDMGEEEVSFKFDKKISYKDIPNETFTVQDLFVLQPLIKEPIEEWEA